ncbi:hypothetical protein HK098_002052 [Nowakowskiella sp. JEL0407]|nr:hypothetical protein HK098_002052 [Nowakowskiella sp. JEL0407]
MSCRYNTVNGICYDELPLTCSQVIRTTSGTYCAGGRFTTYPDGYNCNLATSRSGKYVGNCLVTPVTHNCYSGNTYTYSTATMTRVALVTSNGGCYYPLSSAHSYFEVYTFKYGSVGGVIATNPAISSAGSRSQSSPEINSPGSVVGIDSVGESAGTELPNNNNTLLIIIGVGCGVIVIIVAVVAVIVVRRVRSRSPPQVVMLPLEPVPSQPPRYGYAPVPPLDPNQYAKTSYPNPNPPAILGAPQSPSNASTVLGSPTQSALLLPGLPVTPNFRQLNSVTSSSGGDWRDEANRPSADNQTNAVNSGKVGSDWRDEVNQPGHGKSPERNTYYRELPPNMENRYLTASIPSASSMGSQDDLTGKMISPVLQHRKL